MSERTRVVFDCNTFLQALAAPEGPAGRCVTMALDGTVHLFVSPESVDELRDVAARPKVVAKLRLTPERTEAFLEAIELAATLMDGFPALFAYERDPDDAHYVNLALAARAELIVSRDRDLLDLMDVARPEAREFQNRFPHLRIMGPVQFLQKIDARP